MKNLLGQGMDAIINFISDFGFIGIVFAMLAAGGGIWKFIVFFENNICG